MALKVRETPEQHRKLHLPIPRAPGWEGLPPERNQPLSYVGCEATSLPGGDFTFTGPVIIVAYLGEVGDKQEFKGGLLISSLFMVQEPRVNGFYTERRIDELAQVRRPDGRTPGLEPWHNAAHDDSLPDNVVLLDRDASLTSRRAQLKVMGDPNYHPWLRWGDREFPAYP
jgi:hypothetical protein